MVDDDKRKGENPVPDNLNKYLNDAQLSELHTIESFGWQVKFIRRPLFQDVVVVVVNPDGSSICVLEEDGTVNHNPDITLRD